MRIIGAAADVMNIATGVVVRGPRRCPYWSMLPIQASA